MSKLWRHRALVAQFALLVVAVCLLGLDYWTLAKLESAQRTVVKGFRAAEARPLPIDKVFKFPEVTCAPKPSAALPLPRAEFKPTSAAQTPISVSHLAREQLQYGVALTACVLCGLLLGVTLSYRAASRESRVAQLKSSFVSNVSHEMKTPLATIQMFAETLEEGRVRDPLKLQEYYRVIHKESRRLGQMIEDVLDFARMENHTRRFQLVPCDVGDVVDEVAEDFIQQIHHAGGRLTVDIARPLPPVAADAKALGQAVGNLLSNALKYSPETKDIQVRVMAVGGQVALSVTDCGIGIAEGERERIFEKFYRVDSGLTHNTKGAGLGLAITQHIVKAHGGEIRLESEPGKGSRFTILLPAKHDVSAKQDVVRSRDGEQTAETADRRG